MRGGVDCGSLEDDANLVVFAAAWLKEADGVFGIARRIPDDRAKIAARVIPGHDLLLLVQYLQLQVDHRPVIAFDDHAGPFAAPELHLEESGLPGKDFYPAGAGTVQRSRNGRPAH